jgi:CYTH domain-containing protein
MTIREKQIPVYRNSYSYHIARRIIIKTFAFIVVCSLDRSRFTRDFETIIFCVDIT